MYQYRNIVTGAIINVDAEISGGNWEPVEAPAPAADEKKAPEKKSTRKAVK